MGINCSYSEQHQVPTFAIEWYTSDTSVSVDYLHKNVVDVGITYHAVAEHTALDEHVIDRVEYVWRDHWMLVGIFSYSFCPLVYGLYESTGPKNNPAKLPTDGTSSIYILLTKLFSAMEGAKDSQSPIKFLSR